VTGRSFSPGTPAASTNKTEILLKEESYTINPTVTPTFFFLKSTKEVFSMEGMWHSLNTLTTMGNGHPFLIIIKQTPLPNQEGYISQPRWNVLSSSVGLNPENLHQSPVKYAELMKKTQQLKCITNSHDRSLA